MQIEYEVVFTNINREEIINKIKDLGGVKVKDNTLMKRVVFDTPYGGDGSYIRVRDEGDKVTTTYKEQKTGDLSIESISELETFVGDFDEMVKIYRKLGLKEKSFQESYRELWHIEGEIEFMIDLWPGLTPYIEIEGESEEVVKKYSDLLGFDYSNGIFGSSFEIYERELGIDFETINNLKEITFNNPPKKNSYF